MVVFWFTDRKKLTTEKVFCEWCYCICYSQSVPYFLEQFKRLYNWRLLNHHQINLHHYDSLQKELLYQQGWSLNLKFLLYFRLSSISLYAVILVFLDRGLSTMDNTCNGQRSQSASALVSNTESSSDH